MRILALESSCDESAAAFLEIEGGRILHLEEVVATQAIHAKFGGVVPEIAAREHSVTIPHVLDVLAQKVVGVADGRKLGEAIDLVAATRGPGLITSLKIGLETARALAFAWGKPFVGVNHIAGHVAANWLSGAPLEFGTVADAEAFPALALVVSGGHTELLLMPRQGEYRLLGATRDDAAGEAFDKTAKLMGLGYPGGPKLAALAKHGDMTAFEFPRPMINEPHYDFSFSGLKTSVRYFLDKNTERFSDDKFMADVAASVQSAIVETLVAKAIRAAKAEGVKTIALAGGVSANVELRETLVREVSRKLPDVRLSLPDFRFCTDNAAMIAMAAYFRSEGGKKFDDWTDAGADAGWELGR